MLDCCSMALNVALFVTCLVDQLFPQVGLATARVLERVGCRVNFSEKFTCCGQPAFNSGYWEEALDVAKYFLNVLDELEDYDYIVMPSGSCTSMVKHHYEELFGHLAPSELDRVRRIAAKVYELSQFLVDVIGAEDVGARFEGVATYHDGCHALRELGVRDQPRKLLSKVRGLTLVEMDIPDECCGFGGTFSAKFYPVSGAMVRKKIEAISKTGAQFVVSTDSSCLMQIQGALRRAGLKVQVVHLAEVLGSDEKTFGS